MRPPLLKPALKKKGPLITQSMADAQPQPRTRKTSDRSMMQALTHRVVQTVLDTIDDEQLIRQVRSRLIHPIVAHCLSQMYPYVFFLGAMMLVILLTNVVCCVLFIMNHFFRRRM